ncbi:MULTISPECIES: hypothetical protein [Catenuloplanes]|uniref:Uncharacterized protein n=1 Tax=Catenuloplanes niger TaxID=587534 RepID=A0AAE3ZLA2_9ACTN|nr:hypothetical protein [Catenuloplanes niger]MDR7320705.1 hypothetical protein [Catenuloplanes niger]
MTDPYATGEHRPGRPTDPTPPGFPDIMWTTLVVAVGLNVLSSIAGWPLRVQLATGAIAILCGALLISRHLRRR